MDNTNSGGEKSWLYRMTATFMGLASLVMIALFFVLLNVSGAISDTPVDRSTITVSGEAERYVVPDIATISFDVYADAKTQAEAQTVVSNKMDAIKALLIKQGIEEKDIKTTNLNINPHYESVDPSTGKICARGGYCPWPYEQKQDGFEVRQSTQVKVRNLDDVGEVVAGLSDKEVENLYGPNFEVEEYGDIVEEIKNEAIADAKDKAEARAESLGVKLGKVLSVSDDGYYPYRQGLDYATVESKMVTDGRGGGGAPAPAVDAGENHITASISVTYEIR